MKEGGKQWMKEREERYRQRTSVRNRERKRGIEKERKSDKIIEKSRMKERDKNINKIGKE